MSVKGFPVKQVLVVETARHPAEYYAGVTVDREAKAVVLILSAAGGVDIEEIAAKEPEKIRRRTLTGSDIPDTGDGLLPWLAETFANRTTLRNQAAAIVRSHVQALPREGLFAGGESIPLALTDQGPAGRGRRQDRSGRQCAVQTPGPRWSCGTPRSTPPRKWRHARPV